MEDKSDKETMTSIRLSKSELKSLRQLANKCGFKTVSNLVRAIAISGKISISVEIQKEQ